MNLLDDDDDEFNDILYLYSLSHTFLLKATHEYLKARTRNEITNACIPTPSQSAWAILDRYGNDQAFINQIGLNRTGFENLLPYFNRHFHVYNDGVQGGRPSKLSKRQSLGLLLQYYV